MTRVGVLIDSESARPYQAVIYGAYIAAGVQATITGKPPGVVELAMGAPTAKAWALLLIAGPLLTLAGALWRRHVAGLWLQLAGDSGGAAASLGFSAAIMQTSFSSRATYAAWVAAALALCGAAMVARGIRQIRAVRVVTHRIEQDRDD